MFMNKIKYRLKLMFAYKDALRTRIPFLYRHMIRNAQEKAEKAAAKFFSEIGLEYFAWPQAQSKPDGLTNRVVLYVHTLSSKILVTMRYGKLYIERSGL